MTDQVFLMAYKPYILNFKTPVRMARGVLTKRKGVILKLERGGRVVYSELVPLEAFGSESLESAVNFLASHPEISHDDFEALPANLPATRFAIESAFVEFFGGDGFGDYQRQKMPVSKLLPSGPKLYQALEDGLRDEFSLFKMKIGILDFHEEFEEVKDVIARLPDGVRIRIDANEGLSVDQARRWLGSLENFPVEFLEQPLKRHMIDEMIELTEEFSTEIALDESVATTHDLIRCYTKGFRGVFASKPLRLTELRRFLDWRETSDAKISYSTVFETAIGSAFGIKLAASDKRNSFGLGYGVSDWFKETGVTLPSKPYYALEEILALDKEKIWSGLP